VDTILVAFKVIGCDFECIVPLTWIAGCFSWILNDSGIKL
jgi:hypothetical protein